MDDIEHDAVLVLRCQKHDEKAFKDLVHRWEPRLYYYLRRMIGKDDHIWDLLQEIWLAVFKSICKLNDPRKFGAWIYQITRHKAISSIRKEQRQTLVSNDQMADTLGEVDDCLILQERAESVHQCLSQLSWDQREVMTLYFMEDFTIREIAQITAAPEGTVKSRLYHAKKKACDILKGANDD